MGLLTLFCVDNSFQITQVIHLASQSRTGRQNGPRALGHRVSLLWALQDVADTGELHHHLSHPLTNWK